MTRVYIYLAATLVTAALVWALWYQTGALAVAKAEIQSTKQVLAAQQVAAQHAIDAEAARAAANVKLNKELINTKNKLARALRENKEWADAQVPQGVKDAFK